MSEARRTFLAAEWRESAADDAAVKNAYPLAQEIVEETLLQVAADAATEAERRETIRAVLRHRYELVLPLNSDTESIDLGDVVTLTHDRYGLSAGSLFRVIGIEPDAAERRLTVQVWGPADPTSRMLVALVMAGTGVVSIDLTGSGGMIVSPAMAGTGLRGNIGTGAMSRSPVMAGTGLRGNIGTGAMSRYPVMAGTGTVT